MSTIAACSRIRTPKSTGTAHFFRSRQGTSRLNAHARNTHSRAAVPNRKSAVIFPPSTFCSACAPSSVSTAP